MMTSLRKSAQICKLRVKTDTLLSQLTKILILLLMIIYEYVVPLIRSVGGPSGLLRSGVDAATRTWPRKDRTTSEWSPSDQISLFLELAPSQETLIPGLTDSCKVPRSPLKSHIQSVRYHPSSSEAHGRHRPVRERCDW